MKAREICSRSDLIRNSGVCAMVEGMQIALFYLPEVKQEIYAISNWDPIGKANVLSRGIVGDIDGELVVASPLYKQHFSLIDGHCLEDEKISIPVFQACMKDDQVLLDLP